MTDTYFFKKIKMSDTGLLSIFRLTRSGGNVFGILLGLFILNVFSYQIMFFVLAIVVFFGLRESMSLRDTL